MNVSLLPYLKQRFFNENGEPLAGGKLYSYVAGTSTPAATYVDSEGVTPNENPIVLDANGEADIWIAGGAYKLVLVDENDVPQFSIDNVSAAGQESAQTSYAKYTIGDGQAATDLPGQTLDLSKYTSAFYDLEIIRGNTVIANGPIAIQNLNGLARVKTGMFLAGEPHGVTFSVSQTGMSAQLKVATSTGPGAGTIKLSRRLIQI